MNYQLKFYLMTWCWRCHQTCQITSLVQVFDVFVRQSSVSMIMNVQTVRHESDHSCRCKRNVSVLTRFHTFLSHNSTVLLFVCSGPKSVPDRTQDVKMSSCRKHLFSSSCSSIVFISKFIPKRRFWRVSKANKKWNKTGDSLLTCFHWFCEKDPELYLFYSGVCCTQSTCCFALK